VSQQEPQWTPPSGTGQTPPPQPPPQQPFRPAPQPSSSGGAFKGCIIAIVIVGIVCFLGVIGFIGLVVIAGTSGMAGGTLADGPYNFQEITVGGSAGAPKVVYIPVEGVLFGSAVSRAEYTPVSGVCAQLAAALKDKRVLGVILLVNSPGGGITASDILHREVKEFRTDPGGKPVVTCIMDMAASGGYYVSVASDKIIAHPTSITGSIGVMMPLYDATGLMKKVGLKSDTITSGPYKDIASPFTEKTDEEKQQERALLQEVVDEMHDRFVSVVAEGRSLETEEVRKFADGRIFTAQDALELKLIDQIGYQSDAVDAMKAMLNVSEVHLIQYQRIVTMSDLFTTFAEGPDVDVNVGPALPGLGAGRPMYLWLAPSMDEGVR